VNLRLDAIRAPVLVVVGDADVPDFPAIADRLEAELPDVRKVVLPDTAHTIPLERPDEFRELALEFLREHAG
jgi:pimeloyl-ACP methyl ester carboxylesterase